MIPVNKYPYTDVHELNLDYILDELAKIIAKLKELEERLEALENP